MDYLDPAKQRANMIKLIVGYVLVGIAILFATLILLYNAYGFGVNRAGQVIQKGFVYVSSQPTGAQVSLNGNIDKSTTNARLQLVAGQYQTEINRSGYRTWQRLISVDGGSVQHFDYPLLIPNKLLPSSLKSYSVAPSFTTQSPDKRWLIVQQDATPLNFDLFDLADPKKVLSAVTTVSLPDAVISAAKPGFSSWKLVEWSADNRRLLVQHTYGDAVEYVLIDRLDPTASVNLTKTLSLRPSQQLSLLDKKYDRYYVFDVVAHTLSTTGLTENGVVTPFIDQVLGYKSFGSNVVLYVTNSLAPADKVVTMLRDGSATYKLRVQSAAGPYLLDIAQYNNDYYVVAGSGGDNKVYEYRNPQRVRKVSSTAVLVPIQVLKVTAANHVEFSSNAQYVMAGNGTNIADYDAEYGKGYNFVAKFPIDPPALHASWMDGHRLSYVSAGNVVIFDYDNINGQVLVPASPAYLPIFNRDYDHVYTFTPIIGSAGMTLTATSLLAPADQ